MDSNGSPAVPHPRRPSARFSVCLRHDGPRNMTLPPAGNSQKQSGRNLQESQNSEEVTTTTSPLGHTVSGEVSAVGDWFTKSNNRPQVRLDQTYADGESPYFLPRQDSSNDISDTSPFRDPGNPQHRNLFRNDMHTGGDDGSIDGYRSVIDDLTIENRKLKERLRKYEVSSGSPQLEKDKLFEVKMHGLPARKKRELEETLRAFAATLDAPKSTTNSKPSTKIHHHHASTDPLNNTSSSLTSNSRPLDSAYASNTTSGPNSNSASNPVGLEQKFGHQHKNTKEEKLQSYLHNMPEGLLPKDSRTMTERQKRKVVVRRLEQLFTGEVSVGDHSHPLQQQEVSKSATRADRALDGRSDVEGHREANMLLHEMEMDVPKPVTSDDGECQREKQPLDATTEETSDKTTPDQRPTRPLDLDPDRAQIPSDNVEYIRHLGLSTPKFAAEEYADAAADAEGWIYLNLLVNMAQLHIINVTPDFVRSAVADVSEKFQLSRDGQKVRWRGGTHGTRLSSDSGTNTSHNRSPNDSDSLSESSGKRRKVGEGGFVSVSADANANSSTLKANPFHYQPLFKHRMSSSEDVSSFDESDSPFERGQRHESKLGRLGSNGSGSSCSGRRRGDNGPIVFYTGATFCTDLSGDRGNISTPAHVTGVGQDGYSDHTQDALGCDAEKRPSIIDRTPSGSILPFRPFRSYSNNLDSGSTKDLRPKSAEVLVDGILDLEFSPTWSSDQSSNDRPPLELSASGLGGIRPADHFTAKVETRRTILNGHVRTKLSKFSEPGANSKKFHHHIPTTFLDSFHEKTSEKIISRLASIRSLTPNSPSIAQDMPVKIELMSASFSNLDPSPLPAPSAYYEATPSSDSDSERSSIMSGESDWRPERRFVQTSSYQNNGRRNSWTLNKSKQRTSASEAEDNDDNDVDTDSSIDMLAQARVLDPAGVVAREESFQKVVEKDTGTSVDSINGESGYSTSSESL